MTNLEIFEKVQSNKKRIEEIFDPTTFVLNKEIVALEEEIKQMQDQCTHEFDGGICKFCSKEETK